MCATASIVAVAASVPAPGAEVIDGRGMICMPGLDRTHWHHWTNVCRPFVRNDDPKLGLFPGHREIRSALSAGGFLPQRPARPRRSAERRHHHDAQLVPQHAKPRPRRRRDARHARHRHPRPLCLWRSAGRAERQADGPRRPGPRQARGAAERRLVTLGICSRNIGDDSNPTRGTITIEMAKKEWGAARELGIADHAACFGAADHEASERRGTARARRAVRASDAAPRPRTAPSSRPRASAIRRRPSANRGVPAMPA